MIKNLLKGLVTVGVCALAMGCGEGKAARGAGVDEYFQDSDSIAVAGGCTMVHPYERVLDNAGDPSPFACWRAGEVVSEEAVEAYGLERCFVAVEIPDSVWRAMQGVSYHDYSPVGRANLRYVKALHRDFEGNIRLGELICNKSIAADLCAIFKELYLADYPIEMMVSIDRFDGDDNRSMAANNTSCYNCRRTPGGSRLSRHAYGMAVDINPLYNPYVRKVRAGRTQVLPPEGKAYVDRSGTDARLIRAGDRCHRLFTQRGFTWGGKWRSADYQHFQK